MKNKSLLIFALFLFVLLDSILAIAQEPPLLNSQITITVNEAEMNLPLDSVFVVIRGLDNAYHSSGYTDVAGNITFLDLPTNVQDYFPEQPDDFLLSNPYPQPANSRTNIEFAMSENQELTVSIFNILGQRVATQNVNLRSGYYQAILNLDTLHAGMYIVMFRTRERTVSEKIIKLSSFGARNQTKVKINIVSTTESFVKRNVATLAAIPQDTLTYEIKLDKSGYYSHIDTIKIGNGTADLDTIQVILSEIDTHTIFDNFEPDWRYNTGLGWAVSGKHSQNIYGVEQAMAFVPAETGILSDVWVAFSFIDSPGRIAKKVIIKVATSINDQPANVLEQWEISDFTPFGEWRPPIHLTGNSNTQLRAGTLYWLWATADDSTFVGWNLVTDHTVLSPHTLRREGEDWLRVYLETSSVFKIDIQLAYSRDQTTQESALNVRSIYPEGHVDFRTLLPHDKTGLNTAK